MNAKAADATVSIMGGDALADLLNEPDPLVRYDALTAAQASYEDLAKRIAAERARAVSQMHDAGLSYGGIAELIGFTRSRAQQLVERAGPSNEHRKEGWLKTMGTKEQLVEYLRAYVQRWPRAEPVLFGLRVPPSMADQHTAEEIAEQLVSDVAFRAIRFGTWLSTPQGQIVAAAVEALAPPLVARDIELLTAALNLAVKSERERRTKDLAGKAVAAAGVLLLAFAIKGEAASVK
jgi:hypothetical protein